MKLKFTRKDNENAYEGFDGDEGYYGFDEADGGVDAEGFAAAEPAPFAASNTVALKIVNPKSYDNASEIADYLLNGNTVLLNIEGLTREHASRLLDYLAGATHMVGGLMTKVGKTTIVVAPKNVDVSSIEAMVGSEE